MELIPKFFYFTSQQLTLDGPLSNRNKFQVTSFLKGKILFKLYRIKFNVPTNIMYFKGASSSYKIPKASKTGAL